MSMALAENILAESSLVVAAKDHIGCNLAGEEVILNLASGIYYGLNNVGSRIWELIQKPITVGDILATVVSEYEVDRTQCEAAVSQFLAELAEHGLLEKSS